MAGEHQQPVRGPDSHDRHGHRVGEHDRRALAHGRDHGPLPPHRRLPGDPEHDGRRPDADPDPHLRLDLRAPARRQGHQRDHAGGRPPRVRCHLDALGQLAEAGRGVADRAARRASPLRDGLRRGHRRFRRHTHVARGRRPRGRCRARRRCAAGRGDRLRPEREAHRAWWRRVATSSSTGRRRRRPRWKPRSESSPSENGCARSSGGSSRRRLRGPCWRRPGTTRRTSSSWATAAWVPRKVRCSGRFPARS